MSNYELIFYIFLALGIAATLVFLYLRVKHGDLKGLISKAVASALFICTAVAAYFASGEKDNMFPLFCIMALVFGMMGDIWLDLKWVYPDHNDCHTFAGFSSFAAQQTLMAIGLLLCFEAYTNIWYVVVPLLVGVAFGIGVVALEKPMKLEYGKFKKISMYYCMILVFTTALACSFAVMRGFADMTMNLVAIGMFFFLISDLILSGTYFGEGKDRPVDILSNHAFYYAAQFCIASSLLFLK